jgi:hypothetical protein
MAALDASGDNGALHQFRRSCAESKQSELDAVVGGNLTAQPVVTEGRQPLLKSNTSGLTAARRRRVEFADEPPP